jgi:TonB family protein
LLGAALGSDYYILGDAQTLRRSPSTGPVYFESYASMFVVSSRGGNLIKWYRPSHQASLPAEAEKLLLAELSDSVMRTTLLEAIKTDSARESLERNMISGSPEAIIEEAPSDDAVAAAEGLQLPRPFQRIRPAYPNSAAIADAEATVDVIVDIDSKGEVKHAEVDRWAGFGLDEASLQTVEHMHFFPALRNRVPIPMRVLLRYNFRKPAN